MNTFLIIAKQLESIVPQHKKAEEVVNAVTCAGHQTNLAIKWCKLVLWHPNTKKIYTTIAGHSIMFAEMS